MLAPFLQYQYLDGFCHTKPTMILEREIRPENNELRHSCLQILLSVSQKEGLGGGRRSTASFPAQLVGEMEMISQFQFHRVFCSLLSLGIGFCRAALCQGELARIPPLSYNVVYYCDYVISSQSRG